MRRRQRPAVQNHDPRRRRARGPSTRLAVLDRRRRVVERAAAAGGAGEAAHMSALYVSAARRRQWVVAGASSACRHGQLRGWPQRMRRRRAALRGRPKGRCRDFQRAGGGGNAARGSTPGWEDRCGLEGSLASAGGGARRSDLRWLSLLNFGSSFATWGLQVRRPLSRPLGDPSAGPTATQTSPHDTMYL